MKQLNAKSLFARTVLGLGLGCAALAGGACSGDDMPVPTQGTGNLPSGSGNDNDVCGGIIGITCPAGKFCDFEGNCGSGDIQGVCHPIPSSCSEQCEKTCGCDGVYYCNACAAHLAGVDDSLMNICEEVPPTRPPTIPPAR